MTDKKKPKIPRKKDPKKEEEKEVEIVVQKEPYQLDFDFGGFGNKDDYSQE